MAGKDVANKLLVGVRKVVVIGPESTGKSTLSAALAAALQVPWVPEYAREYLQTLGRPYNEGDLLEIARGQIRLEDELAGKPGGLLICDTDLHVVRVWSEHSYGRCDPWILEQIAQRRYDLYLLTYIDVPWADDPLREHPEEDMRAYFYQQYLDVVSSSGVAWADIRGAQEERLAKALEAIRKTS